MIKFHLSIKEINEKKRERGPLTFGTEELIPALEADLKTANRVRLFSKNSYNNVYQEQEKLKLLLETAHIKIKHLEKKNEELLSQKKNVLTVLYTFYNNLYLNFVNRRHKKRRQG